MFESLVLLMRWGYLVVLSTQPLMKTHFMLKLAEFCIGEAPSNQVYVFTEILMCLCIVRFLFRSRVFVKRSLYDIVYFYFLLQVSSCSECSICCCNLWMYDSAFRIWMNALFVEMCREHGINFIGPNVSFLVINSSSILNLLISNSME